jgi:hypothetical protein
MSSAPKFPYGPENQNTSLKRKGEGLFRIPHSSFTIPRTRSSSRKGLLPENGRCNQTIVGMSAGPALLARLRVRDCP